MTDLRNVHFERPPIEPATWINPKQCIVALENGDEIHLHLREDGTVDIRVAPTVGSSYVSAGERDLRGLEVALAAARARVNGG